MFVMQRHAVFPIFIVSALCTFMACIQGFLDSVNILTMASENPEMNVQKQQVWKSACYWFCNFVVCWTRLQQ